MVKTWVSSKNSFSRLKLAKSNILLAINASIDNKITTHKNYLKIVIKGCRLVNSAKGDHTYFILFDKLIKRLNDSED